MSEWLKTTIPGILVLGAAGSIVAVALLKLFGWLARRVITPRLTGFVAQRIAAILVQFAFVKHLKDSNRLELALAYTAMLGAETTWVRVWLAALGNAIFVYVLVRGLTFSWILVGLIALCFAALYYFTVGMIRYELFKGFLVEEGLTEAGEQLATGEKVKELLGTIDKIKNWE